MLWWLGQRSATLGLAGADTARSLVVSRIGHSAVDQPRVVVCAGCFERGRDLSIDLAVHLRGRIATQQIIGTGIVADRQLRRLTGADESELPAGRWPVARQHGASLLVCSPLRRPASPPTSPTYFAGLIGRNTSRAYFDHGTVLPVLFGLRLARPRRDRSLFISCDDNVLARRRDVAVARRFHLRSRIGVRLARPWQQAERRSIRETEDGCFPDTFGQGILGVDRLAVDNRRPTRQAKPEFGLRCCDRQAGQILSL